MKRFTRLSVLVGVAIGLALAIVYRASLPQPAQAQTNVGDERGNGFDTNHYDPQRVLNAQPAIIKPPLVAANEAEHLSPNELVLGVEIDGVARAYPINTLTGPRREIFNDQLAGHAIAATW